MKYFMLTFGDELIVTETNHRPEFFFAGKCKAWWSITESRGQNLIMLIQAFIYSRSERTIEKYLRDWNISETDCLLLASMLGLYLDMIDNVWQVTKEDHRKINGSIGIVGVSYHPFVAICNYYMYLHVHNINYSLILKKPKQQ